MNKYGKVYNALLFFNKMHVDSLPPRKPDHAHVRRILFFETRVLSGFVLETKNDIRIDLGKFPTPISNSYSILKYMIATVVRRYRSVVKIIVLSVSIISVVFSPCSYLWTKNI